MNRRQAEAYIWLYDQYRDAIWQGYRYGPLTELRDEAQKVVDEAEAEGDGG